MSGVLEDSHDRTFPLQPGVADEKASILVGDFEPMISANRSLYLCSEFPARVEPMKSGR